MSTRHRCPIVRTPRSRGSALSATELARRLMADPHGATHSVDLDSNTFELLAQLNCHLDDAELELLSDAVDHHNDVLITYRDKNGSRSTRAIWPHQLYGKWLDSWCHLRNAQRDFTIATSRRSAPRADRLVRTAGARPVGGLRDRFGDGCWFVGPGVPAGAGPGEGAAVVLVD
jgi:predicted DNA-binding transcriptional regulator YafY